MVQVVPSLWWSDLLADHKDVASIFLRTYLMGNLGTSCCRMWTSWNWPQTWCSSGSTNMPMLWHLTSILAHTYGTLLQSLHTRMVRLQLSEMAAGFHVWLWKNLCTNRNSIRVWGAGRCIRITNLLAMGWHPTNALDWHTKCQPCLLTLTPVWTFFILASLLHPPFLF